jgi:hypothetical protein
MQDPGHAVPRRAKGAKGHAVIKRTKIEIIFQRYPGNAAASAIRGLDYEVTIGTRTRRDKTGADGKVTIRVPAGGKARLKVMGTEYVLSARRKMEPGNILKRAQRRLNMLGYNAGALDGIMGPKTEYAVLNYQADNSPLKVDGLPGPKTRKNLKKKVGK